ncbi:M48 family metalloprotease [Permianibacter sp. IMCC34836]|uniref:M48 family metalloprotease n=1 Tax=Permianibacter fluminis TaxID=2738515 RepID=UPI001553B606|nr:M48 family metalloprotease [Permianibacter fluminis]NQD37605.1 M48 family metalloprotease [Permianibacter fluminis]
MNLRLVILTAAAITLTGCGALKGMQIGDVKLDPFVSAAEKLSNSGEMNELDEIALGGHMAGTLLGASALDPDVNLQRYVNQVGRWVSLQSPRPGLPWKFGVLKDETVNAFAAPGGYVFVTRGLLRKLDSEAELAGVLAHEVQHVNHRHHLKAVQKNNQLGAATDVLGYLGERQINKSGGQHADAKGAVADKLLGATKALYARGLDKDDEYEADKDGIVLMAQAGYDPYAFVSVLQKLEALGSEDSSLALLLQTHPRPADRLKAIANAKVLNNAGPFAENEARFSKAVR